MKRKIKYKDGSVYEGEVNLLGKPNGKGVMTYFWGGVYEGEWKDGKPHGFGKYIYDDGTVFEGSWNMGIEDTGTLTSPNGDIYTGKMRSSDEVVMGVMTYADGEVYDGEWLGTKRHGKGEHIPLVRFDAVGHNPVISVEDDTDFLVLNVPPDTYQLAVSGASFAFCKHKAAVNITADTRCAGDHIERIGIETLAGVMHKQERDLHFVCTLYFVMLHRLAMISLFSFTTGSMMTPLLFSRQKKWVSTKNNFHVGCNFVCLHNYASFGLCKLQCIFTTKSARIAASASDIIMGTFSQFVFIIVYCDIYF